MGESRDSLSSSPVQKSCMIRYLSMVLSKGVLEVGYLRWTTRPISYADVGPSSGLLAFTHLHPMFLVTSSKQNNGLMTLNGWIYTDRQRAGVGFDGG